MTIVYLIQVADCTKPNSDPLCCGAGAALLDWSPKKRRLQLWPTVPVIFKENKKSFYYHVPVII